MEQLYNLYEAKMYSIAFSILYNELQAEDVVQDSFIKLSEYLDKIKSVDCYQTKALIMKIVKTTAINCYRKNKKEALLYDSQEEKITLSDPNDLIEQKLSSIYQSDVLMAAAQEMPDIYKEIIKLKFYYEISNQEIADITGVDCATVRKRYERARKYLYDHIIDNEAGKGEMNYGKESEQHKIQFR